MLLRIIDKPDQKNNDALVEVVFQKNEEIFRFNAEYFPSPMSKQFSEDLRWYFTTYLHDVEGATNDRRVSTRILSLGRHIGDQLLGEDHELIRVKEAIEDGGYQQLQVIVESTRASFFEQPWEMLVLPESSYVLSAVCQSFSRLIKGAETSVRDTEFYYDLSKQEPLTILHIISRPIVNSLEFTSSISFQSILNTLSYDGAVRVEICSAPNWEKLSERLMDVNRPVHIVHFDGPIKIRDGSPYLLLEGSKREADELDVVSLAASMKQHAVSLLSLDCRAYLDSTYSDLVSAERGFALVSQTAHRYGVRNILGTHVLSLPEITSQCFFEVIRSITEGFELGQAVVEARKRLQTRTVCQDFTTEGKPFQFFPLPVLYGNTGLTFFSSPQQNLDYSQSESFKGLKQRLFGFKDELLPPRAIMANDRQFPEVLGAIEEGLPLYLGAGEGWGKSSLGYQVGFYHCLLKKSKFGFSFDFASIFYTRTDILSMIEPILSEDRLSATPCFFLFDNLDTATTVLNGDHEKEDLLALIDELIIQGHTIIATGNSFQGLIPSTKEISVKPPTIKERQRHMAMLLAKYGSSNINFDEDLLSMINSVEGNPFLLEKQSMLLANSADGEIATIAEIFEAMSPEDVSLKAIESFFLIQWRKLSEGYQNLLLSLVETPGILLEMIDLVASKEIKNNPVNELLSRISDEKIVFGEALTTFTQSGFLVQYPHGRLISARFTHFIRQLQERGKLPKQEDEKTSLILSKVLCTSLVMLVPHLQSQPGLHIKQSVLGNRNKWAKHLELVWFAGEFDIFLQTKGALFGLLKQSELSEECAEWSLDIIARSKVSLPFDDVSNSHVNQGFDKSLGNLAWLILATDALDKHEAQLSRQFEEGAKAWRDWLQSQTIEEYGPLTVAAIQFLDAYYLKVNDWSSCKMVNELAYSIFQGREVWSKFISCSKSLAYCCFQLGNVEQGLEYQVNMLSVPPFEAKMQGFKQKLMFEVIASRISNNFLAEAQNLLDEFRSFEVSASMNDVIDSMQSDILIKQENYHEVMPLLRELHIKYVRQGQGDAAEMIKQRISQIEDLIS